MESESHLGSVLLCFRNILSAMDLGPDPKLAFVWRERSGVRVRPEETFIRSGGVCITWLTTSSSFPCAHFPKMEPRVRYRTLVKAHSTRRACPFPSRLFPFSSHEPCYPGFGTEAVKEDGEPSYLRMITIVNIHGWFTYHS